MLSLHCPRKDKDERKLLPRWDDEEGGGNGEYQDGDFDEEDFGVKRKKPKGNSGALTPASTRKKRTPKAK
jgi:hypothetical protein